MSIQSVKILNTQDFTKLNNDEQSKVICFLRLVQNCIDLDDLDSKKTLWESSTQITKDPIHKQFVPLQGIVETIFEYLNSQNALPVISRIWEQIDNLSILEE